MTSAQRETGLRHMVQRTATDRDSARSQRVTSNESEVDLAAVLATELRSSMRRDGNRTSGLPSDVLLDREVNGYRVILMRGQCANDNTTTLSPREQEIARMIAKGYPNKTIAAVLEISTWTVSTHLRRMFAKLGVNSRAAMVARLIHLHRSK